VNDFVSFTINFPRHLIQQAIDEGRATLYVDGKRVTDIAHLPNIVLEEMKQICGKTKRIRPICGIVKDRIEICRLKSDHINECRFEDIE